MDLKGKAILITGAGKRMGAALALAISAKGAKIGIHYNRSKKEAETIAKAIEKNGGTCFLTQGDISQAKDCRKIVAETVQALGRLDVLINNAAVFFKTPLLETTEKDWDEILDTNLKGAFFCAQAAAAIMQKNKTKDAVKGKIINVADWAADRPHKNYLPYCISKAGIIALTKGLARILAPAITVNAISPGTMLLPEDCDANEENMLIDRTPLKRIGSPEDIIAAVLFVLEGTDFMTGSTIVVDGGRLIA